MNLLNLNKATEAISKQMLPLPTTRNTTELQQLAELPSKPTLNMHILLRGNKLPRRGGGSKLLFTNKYKILINGSVIIIEIILGIWFTYPLNQNYQVIPTLLSGARGYFISFVFIP